MSKLSKKPIFLIIFFVVGVLLGFYLSVDERVWICALIVCLVVVAFRQFLVLSLVLTIFVGAIYMQMFLRRSQTVLPEGCYNGTVAMIPIEGSNSFQAAFETDNGVRAIIKTEDDILVYQQRLKICFHDGAAETVAGSYGRYLLGRFQSQRVITNPQIEILGNDRFWSVFFGFKDSVVSRLKRIYIGDKGTLASGLILGGSQDFSDDFKQAMKGSGTSHLVAVSGYNVSIITIVIFGLLRALFSRRTALTSSIVILIGFCLITGASASVVRAAVMGVVYLLSKALGRKVSPLHLLSVAAFIMILLNPFSLFDVGFQLSFAATFGLVMAIDIFEYFSRDGLVNKILMTIPETLVAQLFTVPIMLYQFKQTSLISVIPNALILPLVPTVMFFIFVAVLFGFVNIYLGMLAGVFGEIFLRYFIFIIKYFGSMPIAKVDIQEFPLYLVLISYVVIISMVVFAKKKIDEKELQQNI